MNLGILEIFFSVLFGATVGIEITNFTFKVSTEATFLAPGVVKIVVKVL